MTQIAFHFGAPDKMGYACRLLRKAANTGKRVLVVADAPTCARLNEQLWAVSPVDFVTHCRADAPRAMLERSSAVLVDVPAADARGISVMLNLGDQIPSGFEAFERLIEVVSLDDVDRQYARERWKRYTAAGYAIERHDLKLTTGTAS